MCIPRPLFKLIAAKNEKPLRSSIAVWKRKLKGFFLHCQEVQIFVPERG